MGVGRDLVTIVFGIAVLMIAVATGLAVNWGYGQYWGIFVGIMVFLFIGVVIACWREWEDLITVQFICISFGIALFLGILVNNFIGIIWGVFAVVIIFLLECAVIAYWRGWY